MFYSQFILAKKGPLGTIWIAAHLERKLRKNQVADTDIGVSVDSILFPEVPIALRLSSHLLLGVVRIYSRKVNYLFHDCSEALLKVKQAFRSTAVDLPPEESTAPYHSITLPETFDLDDFELPDSDIFQGNYVDHHISSREQITLQDTLDGVAYSTSKFGLDERFGDGDASQIGLDLDEELFLDKGTTPVHATDVLDPDDVDLLEPTQPVTPFSIMEVDENQMKYGDDRIAEDMEVMQIDADEDHLHANDLQLEIAGHSPDLNENCFPTDQIGTDTLNEFAPSTSAPKISVETSLSNGHHQGVPSLSMITETSPCNSVEVIRSDATCNVRLEFEYSESPKLVHDENERNYSNKADSHAKDTNDAEDSLLSDKSSKTNALHMTHEERIEVKHKEVVDSPSATVPVTAISLGVDASVCSPTSVLAEPPKLSSPASECLERTLDAPEIGERLQTSQNGVTPETTASGSFIDQTQAGLSQPEGISVDVTVASHSTEASSMPPTDAEVACLTLDSINNCDRVSKDGPESVLIDMPYEAQDSANVRDMPGTCSPNHVLPSSVGSPLGPVVECDSEKIDGKVCHEPEVREPCSNVGLEGKLGPDGEMLKVCSFRKNCDGPSLEVEAGSLEIFGRENQVDGSRSSALMQGEVLHQTGNQDMISEENQMLESCPSDGVQADLRKLEEPHNNVCSKDNQSDNLNCPSNCDLPAPEMLLSAPATAPDLPSNLVSSEKEVVSAEGEGSEGGLKILSGKKRHFMETTPILHDENSAKLSGVSRSKRIIDSVPDDDDLLSSILVGRRSSALKMRPTPPPPELASSKRSRLNPRTSLPKRKVHLDDTMVLHGDTIRQQLTSTEDIRRTRRKAPCTRPEIWMIQRHLLEDEVFYEPVFTGILADLSCLHNRANGLTDIRVYDVDDSNIVSIVQNKSEISMDGADGANFDDGQKSPVISENVGKAHETTETLMLTENHLSKDLPISSAQSDTQGQTDALENFPGVLEKAGELVEISTMEIDKLDNEGADGVEQADTLGADEPTSTVPISNDRFNESSCSMLEVVPISKSEGSEVVLQHNDVLNGLSAGNNDFSVDKANCEGVDASDIAGVNNEDLTSTINEGNGSTNHKTEINDSVHVVSQSTSQECQSDFSKLSSFPGAVGTMTDGSVENGGDLPPDFSAHLDHTTSPLRDVCVGDDGPTGQPCITGCLAPEEIRSEPGDMFENEILDNRLRDGEGQLSPQLMSNEELQMDSSFQLGSHDGDENVPHELNKVRDDEANNGMALEEENAGLNNASLKDYDDFGNAIDGNDTEFLNFDDDDVHEEDEDNSMPTTEEPRLLDNSGWSSRTRAVAKFLQTLFDKESGDGRKVLSMDNLLSGKTRKEASRMFFETLVLKTRDYIHVEQESPFNNINIKPKLKLMKSEF